MEEFFRKFNFQEENAFLVGIERERILVDNYKNAVPRANEVLALLDKSGRFGPELSACQIEDRVGPKGWPDLYGDLKRNDKEIAEVLQTLCLWPWVYDIGPANMPLDVFPDPSGRFAKIASRMPQEVLRAACRVIGTHVHVGMPDFEKAIDVYNNVIKHIQSLIDFGDNSNGDRIRLYQMVAPNCMPREYKDKNDFYEAAIRGGFADDPRKCWDLIRLSVHGTIEFRMFGMTNDNEVIVWLAEKCYHLCLTYF